MTYEEYEEGLRVNKEALDKIDFLPLLEKYKGCSMGDLRTELEEVYDNTNISNVPYLEGCILNWMSDGELIEYLEERYPKQYYFPEYTVNLIAKRK